MTTYTVLQMTQEILSSLGSDQVNSINDSPESVQVATILNRVYDNLTLRGDLPEHYSLFQLTPSNDVTKPTLMYVPSGVANVRWIKYFDTSIADSLQQDQFGAFSHDLNIDIVSSSKWTTTSSTSNTIGLGSKTFTVASSTLPIIVGQGAMAQSGTSNMFGNVLSYVGTTLTINVVTIAGSGTFNNWVVQSADTNAVAGYKFVTILPSDQFIDMINGFSPSDTDVASYTFTETGENFTFYYKNDRQPMYCCVLSNQFVLFDSFDMNQDNTLQASKTLVFGEIVPAFQLVDTFIPAIDDKQFPLLINEAKSTAWFELKQTTNPKAEQESKRYWSALSKDKSFSNKPTYFDQFPYFGRR
jgi:hypothetical protein